MDKCGKCKGNGKIRYDRQLNSNPELAVAGEYICPECEGSGVIKQVVDKPPVMRRFETDVTEKVKFGNNDDEYLPIEKCVCGAEFGSWSFVINVYKDDPNECPKCGRKYYFRNEIKVYLIE